MSMPLAPDPTLIGIFETEVAEGVGTLHAHLLQIEGGATDRSQRLEEMLRLAHDLKGSARVVGYELVARLAHALEHRLVGWRRRERVEATEIDLALRASDALRDLAVHPQDAALISQVKGHIEALEAAGDSAPAPAATAPAASPVRRLPEPEPEPVSVRERPSPRGETLRIARTHIDAVSEDVATTLFDCQRADERLDELNRALTTLESVRLPRSGAGPREIARSSGELRTAMARVRTCVSAMRDTLRQSQGNARQLDDHARALCLVPVTPLVVHLERVARDAAAALGRRLVMQVEGRELHVDMVVLEALKAPLTHAVRNAVDHGLETPEERAAAGKPLTGTLRLQLREDGDRLHVSIGDDGRGIDRAAVRARLGARAEGLDDRQLLATLLRAGLSTRDQVTQMSGRGLGLGTLAVVADQLRGDVDVESREGHGTTLTLRLPLRLSLLEGLLVEAGGSSFVLPVSGLSGVDGKAPLSTTLSALLRLPASGSPARAVQLKGRDRDVSVAVDVVRERVEVVRRAVGSHLGRLPFVDGATILPNGEPAFILDAREIAAACGGTAGARHTGAGSGPHRRRVLIVDDSPTLRAKLHHDLCEAGFDVVQAEDGVMALERLAAHGCDVVVSDVQMPRLDGFGLLARCGAQVPVILVTAWPDQLAEVRARELGAAAYIPKDDHLTEHVVLTLRTLLDHAPETRP